MYATVHPNAESHIHITIYVWYHGERHFPGNHHLVSSSFDDAFRILSAVIVPVVEEPGSLSSLPHLEYIQEAQEENRPDHRFYDRALMKFMLGVTFTLRNLSFSIHRQLTDAGCSHQNQMKAWAWPHLNSGRLHPHFNSILFNARSSDQAQTLAV